MDKRCSTPDEALFSGVKVDFNSAEAQIPYSSCFFTKKKKPTETMLERHQMLLWWLAYLPIFELDLLSWA